MEAADPDANIIFGAGIDETMGEDELMQACRELLADECGECGYESFEDTADGIIGYVQQDEYHEILVKEKIKE